MNKNLFIGLWLSVFLLSSCGQSKNISYRQCTSADNSYTLQVPANASQTDAIADLLAFGDKNQNLNISIAHAQGGNISDNVSTSGTGEGFVYTPTRSSDSCIFYRVTRGNNFWVAHDLYMLKQVGNTYFIINVNSDKMDESDLISIIEHIYASLQLSAPVSVNQQLHAQPALLAVADNKPATVAQKPDAVSLSRTYSTPYYSVKYPQGWQYQENLNEMTDVYIGSEPDNFGFTLVRGNTDYSLVEVMTQGDENLRQAGFRVLESKKTTVSGRPAYRSVHEVSVSGEVVRHISYTFKKGEMLFNVKFGSVTSKAQEVLAAQIMQSFHLK